MLIDNRTAFAELSDLFCLKGWGILTCEEFTEGLRADSIRPFVRRTPDGAERKAWLDRQNKRIERSA